MAVKIPALAHPGWKKEAEAIVHTLEIKEVQYNAGIVGGKTLKPLVLVHGYMAGAAFFYKVLRRMRSQLLGRYSLPSHQ